MTAHQLREDPMAERVITGRQVLLGLIAFFGIIFGVNAVFLYSALSTHTGVVSNEPYRKGLHYNERIEADRQQNERGWQTDVAIEPTGDAVAITLLDRNGRPLTGLNVAARVGRPSTSELDIRLEMKETTPGHYGAKLAKLDAGNWLIDVEARELRSKGDDALVWRARKRLWLKP